MTARPQTHRSPTPKEPSKPNKKHQNELLDEALEATFPASDPLAMLDPLPELPQSDDDREPESHNGGGG